jgi:hypothetical protein
VRALPTSRSAAMHEAHHAAALCLLGMVPKCVRTDWPEPDLFGTVTVDWCDGPDRDTAGRVLLALVLGGMTEGHKGWRTWPIDPDRVAVGARRDAEQARTLANYLKLDNAGWLHVLWKANQLGRQRDFRRLAVLIADQLERVEVLTADDLGGLMTRDAEAAAA